MSYEAEQDPLCYLGTTVLINSAGLTDQTDLDDFELSMYLTRADEPLPQGNLGYAHYCAIHHHLFQDVYSWAGTPRTIRIAKGGNWFCFPEHLDRMMAATFAPETIGAILTSPTTTEFAAHRVSTVGNQCRPSVSRGEWPNAACLSQPACRLLRTPLPRRVAGTGSCHERHDPQFFLGLGASGRTGC